MDVEPWGEDPKLVEVLGEQGAAEFRAMLDGFPEAVGVLWAVMTCPAAVMRNVNGVPDGMLVVARLMVMFPAAVKITSGVLRLPLGGFGTTCPATLVMRMSPAVASPRPLASGGAVVWMGLTLRLDGTKNASRRIRPTPPPEEPVAERAPLPSMRLATRRIAPPEPPPPHAAPQFATDPPFA